MDLRSKIYVAGHGGMVGSAILRCLGRKGYGNLIYATSSELDLKDTAKVNRFLVSIILIDFTSDQKKTKTLDFSKKWREITTVLSSF